MVQLAFNSVSAKQRLLRIIALPFWTIRFLYYVIKGRNWAFLRFYPGYHGSTIPSKKFIKQNRDRIFQTPPTEGDGIELNRARQHDLLERFVAYFHEFAPSENQTPTSLYYYNNPMFGFSDAFALFGMFREMKPTRVIEIGSGFSSALMLDISRDYLSDTSFTFIDPYSQTIGKVLKSRPGGHYELIRREAQDIGLDFFKQLGDGDILFIDTSHSVKIGSDLSTIFFSILPSLRTGVIIHIHDIYFPWEYPEEMVLEGRTYNEVYFVRAFLQYNNAFEIIYNTSQLEKEEPDVYRNRMPGYFKNSGQPFGQSLWLKKIR